MEILEIVPLLPLQKTMLYKILSNPSIPVFGEQWRYKVTGRIDVSLIEKAWQKTINSYDILHGVFQWEHRKSPVFLILKSAVNRCQIYHLENFKEADKTKQADRIAWKEYHNPVNLNELPIRMTITLLSENCCEWIITSNHILFDGWSNSIIMNNFIHNYFTLCDNRKIQTQSKGQAYSDYVRYVYQEQNNSQHINYWKNYINGYIFSQPYTRKRKNGNRIEQFPLTESQIQMIQRFCRLNGFTLSVVLYTIWASLLYIENPRKTIIIGATVSGRNLLPCSYDDVVGLLAKTLPMQISFDNNSSIVDIMTGIRTDLIDIEEHMHVTPEIWLDILPNIQECFSEGLTIQNYPVQAYNNKGEIDFQIEFYQSNYYTDMDFSISIKTFIQPNSLEINYSADRYSSKMVHHRINLYLHILQSLIQLTQSEIKNTCIISWLKNL
ncbi:surfactin synthase subunit 2 [Clostridiales bacterium]|nr:surfactin synthase subunit 2 [Clostridiales bacterium]